MWPHMYVVNIIFIYYVYFTTILILHKVLPGTYLYIPVGKYTHKPSKRKSKVLFFFPFPFCYLTLARCSWHKTMNVKIFKFCFQSPIMNLYSYFTNAGQHVPKGMMAFVNHFFLFVLFTVFH